MTEAETGTVVYAYIGEAMTMSEPPITNGQLFFVHVTDVERRAGLHRDRVGEKRVPRMMIPSM